MGVLEQYKRVPELAAFSTLKLAPLITKQNNVKIAFARGHTFKTRQQ